jgi:hypothetical protein
MISRLAPILAVVSSLAAVPFALGCCFGGGVPTAPVPTVAPVVPAPPMVPPVVMPGMPGMPGMPASVLPGAGALPTSPPLTFAGVTGPLPMIGVPAGTPGEILTSGTATVRIASGSLPGVASGTVCSYAQFRVDPAVHTFECRWNVTCGNSVVYGMGDAGFQPACAQTLPGVFVMDSAMTSSDGDGMFIFNSGGMTIGDDSGPLGAFTLTLTVP